MIVGKSARVERNITIIGNALVRDRALSFAARGVMAYVLSFPDGKLPEREDILAQGDAVAIDAALLELERAELLSFERKPVAKPGSDAPAGVDEQTWADFKALRLRRRAPITPTVLKAIKREARMAGWTMQQALAECCARGWQGFKADWVAGRLPTYQERMQSSYEVVAPMAAHRSHAMQQFIDAEAIGVS